MNLEALKKALIRGIPTGIASWLIYGLVFRLLIDKKPFKEALFGRDSIIFLIIVVIVEIIIYYVDLYRKSKKE